MSATIKKTVYHSTDEVLQEIWRIKDALSASRGHSVEKLFADARERQKKLRAPASLLQFFQNSKSGRRQGGCRLKIKPSLREFEALLAHEEKVNA